MRSVIATLLFGSSNSYTWPLWLLTASILGRERDLEDEDSRIRDVDDLILAARAGNYIEVLEIVLHPSHPVSPNQLNEDGITATYATLMMILKREVLDSEADLANLGLSRLERFWKALRKKVEVEPKLDLVLRALLYCGGKVDFQKMESGVDGTAVIHSAAETGALDMVDWLLKKGESFSVGSVCFVVSCGTGTICLASDRL